MSCELDSYIRCFIIHLLTSSEVSFVPAEVVSAADAVRQTQGPMLSHIRTGRRRTDDLGEINQPSDGEIDHVTETRIRTSVCVIVVFKLVRREGERESVSLSHTNQPGVCYA